MSDAVIKIDDLKEVVKEAFAKSNETMERRQKKADYTNNEADIKLAEASAVTNKSIHFLNDLFTGDKTYAKGIHDSRKKTLNETTSTLGGYLVPEEFEKDVVRYMNEYSEIRQNSTVLSMASDVKRLNSLTGEPTVYIVGEASQITASDLTFGEPVLTAKKYGAIVDWSSELEEDSEAPLLALVQERIALGLAQKEEDEFVNGVTSGSEGLLVVSGVTGITLNSGSTFSNLTWDDLADMQASLYAISKNEAQTGKFYMSMTAYNILRQTKAVGDGNYFQMPSAPSAETPAYAWGRQIVVCQSFPTTTATGTKFVAFGDLKKHSFIGDRRGITVTLGTEGTVGSNNLFEKDMVALRVTKRTAYTCALPSGIVTLATN